MFILTKGVQSYTKGKGPWIAEGDFIILWFATSHRVIPHVLYRYHEFTRYYV